MSEGWIWVFRLTIVIFVEFVGVRISYPFIIGQFFVEVSWLFDELISFGRWGSQFIGAFSWWLDGFLFRFRNNRHWSCGFSVTVIESSWWVGWSDSSSQSTKVIFFSSFCWFRIEESFTHQSFGLLSLFCLDWWLTPSLVSIFIASVSLFTWSRVPVGTGFRFSGLFTYLTVPFWLSLSNLSVSPCLHSGISVFVQVPA